MNILVVYARRMQSHFDTFAIRVFRHYLSDLGININFTQNPLPSNLMRFDLVLLVQWFLYNLLPADQRSIDGILRLLDRYDQINIPVIWLDASDTVGPIKLAVLDRVRVYAMRQLLKDRLQYTHRMLHGSLFENFYYRTFNLSLPDNLWFASVPAESLNKLAVFWNIAFSDWRVHQPNRFRRAVGIVFPNPKYQLRLTAPNVCARPIDISCRVSSHSRFPVINFHRELVRSAVMQMSDRHVVRAQGKIPRRAYEAELRSARIVVSPFGWGEICYRDFEAFAAGSIVVKPDMSHLDTFPDCFFPNQTYVPHQWDMSDFSTTIDHVLSNINDFREIAYAGQQRFVDVCRDGESFAKHFHALIKKALSLSPSTSSD